MNEFKTKKTTNELGGVKIKFVTLEEKKENERIKKIARLFDRILEKKSRNKEQGDLGFKGSLEETLGI